MHQPPKGPESQNPRKLIDLRQCPSVGIDIAALAMAKLYELYGIHHPSISGLADRWLTQGPKNVDVLLPDMILEIDSPTVTEAYLAMRLVHNVQDWDIR